MKVLFFHIPSLGQYNPIEPILTELMKRGHTVIHYNAEDFRCYTTDPAIRFSPYKNYHGFHPKLLSRGMSVYDLGSLLVETAQHTIHFVESEVHRESPDVILHSKFAAAPKAIARKHHIPAVCLTTGYVFHPTTVLDRGAKRAHASLANVASLWRFKKEAKKFYDEFLEEELDENDMFINEEIVNLVLGLEQFQPKTNKFSPRCEFIGPTMHETSYSKTYDLIYASLGSIFVGDVEFFEVCIRALGGVGRPAIISLSDRCSAAGFSGVPENVELVNFVRQTDVLQRTAVFITHGGATSVYEAIQCETPMIAIPQTPEQLFYARAIEGLMLGKCIERKDLTVRALMSAVLELLNDKRFRRSVQKFKRTLPTVPAALSACLRIEEYNLNASIVGAT